MVLRIDEDSTRAAVLKAWANAKPPADADEQAIANFTATKRSALLQAELAVFCLTEMERNINEPMKAIETIGYVLGNGLSNITEMVHGKTSDGDLGAHAAIHVLLDKLSGMLHQLHYAREEGTIKDHVASDPAIIVRNEIGDA